MKTISAKWEIDDGGLRGTGLWRSSFLSKKERRALVGAVVSPRSVDAHIDLVREREHAEKLLLIVERWACRCTTTRESGRQSLALVVPDGLDQREMIADIDLHLGATDARLELAIAYLDGQAESIKR